MTKSWPCDEGFDQSIGVFSFIIARRHPWFWANLLLNFRTKSNVGLGVWKISMNGYNLFFNVERPIFLRVDWPAEMWLASFVKLIPTRNQPPSPPVHEKLERHVAVTSSTQQKCDGCRTPESASSLLIVISNVSFAECEFSSAATVEPGHIDIVLDNISNPRNVWLWWGFTLYTPISFNGSWVDMNLILCEFAYDATWLV